MTKGMANESQNRSSFNKTEKQETSMGWELVQDKLKLAHREPPAAAVLKPFEYSPLDPSIDSIRLVHLLPAPNLHSPIYCRLTHATFAQKPRYEVLSYALGLEEYQLKITLDGQDFGVNQNIFNALCYLPDKEVERTIWIDAICIQQKDIPERNRQLRIMPNIYERAKVVLVWLGDISASVLNDIKWTFLWARSSSGSDSDILIAMCRNDYWRRVWIVQEIGKARRVWVHANKYKVEWSTFIALLKRSGNLDNTVPVKLQTQLEEKYNSGHKLHNLLESHQDSL